MTTFLLRLNDVFFNIMGTNCVPPDLFLYYYVADFIPELIRKKDKKLAISFQFNVPLYRQS